MTRTTPPNYLITSSESDAATTAIVGKNGYRKGGLSTSDKIALGDGSGVGLLVVFVATPGCYVALKRLPLAW